MWCVGGLLSGEAAGARRRDRGTTVQHNRSTYRLTLNILLSFAQFEREVIAERTRDTIAAMRRKGKWCGGRPILGYDVALDTRGPRLVVNPAEAAQVREIFTLYLSLRSLLAIGGTTHRRPRSHCPMQSNVLSDVPEYHPFFGTCFVVPSNGAAEDFGTEGTSCDGDAPSGGRSKERFATDSLASAAGTPGIRTA